MTGARLGMLTRITFGKRVIMQMRFIFIKGNNICLSCYLGSFMDKGNNMSPSADCNMSRHSVLIDTYDRMNGIHIQHVNLYFTISIIILNIKSFIRIHSECKRKRINDLT